MIQFLSTIMIALLGKCTFSLIMAATWFTFVSIQKAPEKVGRIGSFTYYSPLLQHKEFPFILEIGANPPLQFQVGNACKGREMWGFELFLNQNL